MKILLYGDAFNCSFRSQALIRFLLESKHYISIVCPNFYISRKLKKVLLLEKLFTGLHLIELFMKAAFTDVIYILPHNTNLIKNAIWVSKLFNKQLVTEIHILLYDTFVKDRRLYSETSQEAKKVKQKDILALTKSSYIVSTSNHELTYWVNNLGISFDQSKAFIAPIFSSSNLTLKRSFMQDRSLRICWWGTFIPLHGLDNILQAMKLLKETEINFTCNLFGVDNSLFRFYVEKIQLMKLDSHVFLRKDLKFFDNSLPHYLVENCDLALGIFGDTEKAYHALPNKLIEALSMAIPTLTMNSPALKEFFDPVEDLWVCEYSPVSITEAIIEIANGTAYPVDWDNTRQKVLKNFSVTQYQLTVEQVLGKVADDLWAEESLKGNYSKSVI